MYEGKFRDFMVGWLAEQLKQPELTRDQIEALYDGVTDADNDEMALTEVGTTLGSEIAARLLCLCRQWSDPTIDAARDMIEALRDRVQEDYHDQSDFYLFFLNPFKEGCVPDGFTDNLEREIIWMFQTLYYAAGAVALEPYGWEPDVTVEPSYEDASFIVMLAHPKGEVGRRVFLFDQWYKAWHLRYANLTELAEALLSLREMVESCTLKAILGYHIAETVAEVLDGIKLSSISKEKVSSPEQDPTKVQPLWEFTDKIAYLVTDLNGLASSIVNQEVTLAEVESNLPELFAKLTQVEWAINELSDVFWKHTNEKEAV